MTYQTVIDRINQELDKHHADYAARQDKYQYFQELLRQLGQTVGRFEQRNQEYALCMRAPDGAAETDVIVIYPFESQLRMNLFPIPSWSETGRFNLDLHSKEGAEGLIATHVAQLLASWERFDPIAGGTE
jgi:hypothetical protein